MEGDMHTDIYLSTGTIGDVISIYDDYLLGACEVSDVDTLLKFKELAGMCLRLDCIQTAALVQDMDSYYESSCTKLLFLYTKLGDTTLMLDYVNLDNDSANCDIRYDSTKAIIHAVTAKAADELVTCYNTSLSRPDISNIHKTHQL